MLLFIGDVSDEKGWRSVHLNMETGYIEEHDQDGEEMDVREPSAKELLIATVEWCNAHQDSSFPATLYHALKNKM